MNARQGQPDEGMVTARVITVVAVVAATLTSAPSVVAENTCTPTGVAAAAQIGVNPAFSPCAKLFPVQLEVVAGNCAPVATPLKFAKEGCAALIVPSRFTAVRN